MSEASYKFLRDPIFYKGAHITAEPNESIRIHHPAYLPGATLLLRFRGHDSSSGAIDFNLVHTACAVVAGNRFDGYLSRQDVLDAQPLEHVSALEPGNYYFHVPPPLIGNETPLLLSTVSLPDAENSCSNEQHNRQRPYLYPVVVNFKSWQFPNSDTWSKHLKQLWSSSVLTLGHADPSACVLSGHTNATDLAHIVPQAEAQWFLINDMNEYLSRNRSRDGNNPIDDPWNLIRLRTDIHRLLDNKKLAFVPKRCDDTVCMYTHCYDFNEQLIEFYHNRPLPCLPQVSPECLFARFVWGLFPLTDFLSISTCQRLLRIRNELGQAEDRKCSVQEARMYMSRSISPRKRNQPERSLSTSRSDPHQARSILNPCASKIVRRNSMGFVDTDYWSEYMTDDDWGEEPRGRSRKRRCELSPRYR